jgi:hypothetical protein
MPEEISRTTTATKSLLFAVLIISNLAMETERLLAA